MGSKCTVAARKAGLPPDEVEELSHLATGLKPAVEPIILARKPLAESSVLSNVRAHGTGALNVDSCRIEVKGKRTLIERADNPTDNTVYVGRMNGTLGGGSRKADGGTDLGRYPANVLLDEAAAQVLDDQAGIRTSGVPGVVRITENRGATYGSESRAAGTPMVGYGDTGGVSRFFYCSKASRTERPSYIDGNGDIIRHITVKPFDLMRWLVTLVTPVGGTILDPFAGSGTTLEAGLHSGFSVIGIESHAPYLSLIEQRIARIPVSYGE